MLSEQQKNLYLRNILVEEIGEAGQEKLLSAKILVIGAGGLGSATLQYLACGGVGNITVIDHDIVELSNLQRQIIHNFHDLGIPKVQSAETKIKLLAPDINFIGIQQKVNHENLTKFVKDFDIVADCTDNFASRFLINLVCFEQKKPLIFGAVKGFSGQLAVFNSYQKNQPCYACFNHNDENIELTLTEKGILGAVAGTLGSMMAIYAIKEILNLNNDLKTIEGTKIMFFDFLKNNFRLTKLKKNPSCKVCSSQKI
jgi:adenylyltransferase/sulfurtransferase